MFKKHHYICGYDNEKNVEITYPEICPVCHTRVRPNFVYGHMMIQVTEFFPFSFRARVERFL